MDKRTIDGETCDGSTGADLPLGAHLITPRRGYSHHGIHVGGGRVVHYAGLFSGLHRGPVAEVLLAQFAGGRAIRIKAGHGARYSGPEVAARARSRLGEDRYRLFTNNCEHFCEWCVGGESRSEQVAQLEAWPRRVLHSLLTAGGRAFQVGVRAPAGAC